MRFNKRILIVINVCGILFWWKKKKKRKESHCCTFYNGASGGRLNKKRCVALEKNHFKFHISHFFFAIYVFIGTFQHACVYFHLCVLLNTFDLLILIPLMKLLHMHFNISLVNFIFIQIYKKQIYVLNLNIQ